jgi:uncharacterized protein (TIGR03435 family)
MSGKITGHPIPSRRNPGRAVASLVLGVALASATSVESLHGQPATGATAGTAFEVASVKRNTIDLQARTLLPVGMHPPSGSQFSARAVTLRDLIRFAYQFRQLAPDQVIGGPGWMNTNRYDVVAKAADEFAQEPDGTSPQLYAMVRALIADRFKVQAHLESRELPIYALVLARKDGQLGPQLIRANIPCERPAAAGTPAPSGPTRRCQGSLAPGVLASQGITMSQVAQLLGNVPAVARTVRDETALTGEFDVRLDYTPALDAASIFTVLQEQLGLKLDPQKGPVDVLIIDHVEELTEN